MRLRQVSIVGFKTFARRSELVLDHGVTAVVGPNGSGKSNFVDAIRWALGEGSARELRGIRSDDVIYAGGRGKPRMGLAEVEIVLDNESGRLPLDDPEVAVRRRVVRGGDSEYRLNGSRTRLRDVDRLLGATGLTQSGYAVVAQNDIDGIIQATPTERRVLIEQAAGVRPLRAACQDVGDRVRRAANTLRRLDDLLQETEPRLIELTGQAELASVQRSLTERLAELRGSLAREAWRVARTQLKQARRRHEAAITRLGTAESADRDLGQQLERATTHRTALRQQHRSAASHLEQARLAAERADGDTRRWQDRLVQSLVQHTTARREVLLAEADSAVAADRLEDLSQLAGDAAIEMAAVGERMAVVRSDHDCAVAASVAQTRAVQVAEVAALAAGRARAEATAAVHEAAARLQIVESAVVDLEGGATTLRRRVIGLRDEAAQAARSAADIGAELAGAVAAAAAADERLRRLRNDLRERTRRSDQCRADAQRAMTHAATLRGQVDGALGGTGGLAAAVGADRLSARRLLELFTVADPEDLPAVEAALEVHLGGWVIDDLAQGVEHFADDGIREELIRRDRPAEVDDDDTDATDEDEDGGARALGLRPGIDAVVVDAVAGAAVNRYLAGVWLATDLATALRAVADTGRTVVTQDGIVVTATTIRGGGRPGRTLEMASAERAAAALAQAAEMEVAAAEAAVTAVLAECDEAEVSARRAGETAQRLRIAVAETKATAAATMSTVTAEERRLDGLDRHHAARRRELEGLVSRLQSCREAEVAVTTTGVDVVADVSAAREAAETLGRQAQAVADLVRVTEARETEARLRITDLARQVESAELAVRSSAERLRGGEIRLLNAEMAALPALVRSAAARRRATAAQTTVTDAAAAIAGLQPGLEGAERETRRIEREGADVAVALARSQDEVAAAEAELATVVGRVAELAKAVHADDLDEGAAPDADEADRAEREILRLERRIAGLGPVNALAPEQLEALRGRVERYRADRSDLGGACADLTALAVRLEGESERRFEAVFGAASAHFSALFEELFPGGRASLRLASPPSGGTDDQEGIVLGVEIVAQPPGKRLQALNLLSGGERALTALAMILALQHVKPSPFYVFDEVDAALDDANVVRFNRLLRRLAEHQQFIVVTHNHVTMAAADALYGISADGDGVSSILSVRLANGEAAPESVVAGPLGAVAG